MDQQRNRQCNGRNDQMERPAGLPGGKILAMAQREVETQPPWKREVINLDDNTVDPHAQRHGDSSP